MSRRIMGPWMKGPIDALHTDTYEISILLSGHAQVRLGDSAGRQRDGEVALIPPHTLHSSWTEDAAVEEVTIHVDAAAIEAEFGSEVGAGLHTASELGPSLVRATVDALLGEPEILESCVLELMRALAGGQVPVGDARVLRVLDAVRDDLTRAWTVDAMANIAAMSPAHFSRRFRSLVGKSPMQHVLEYRVNRASFLMETSSASLTEIAHRVGFRSSSRFSEAFQRSRGVSPTRWRAVGSSTKLS